MASSFGNVPDTVLHSILVVAGTFLVFIRCGRCHALYDIVTFHVAG